MQASNDREVIVEWDFHDGRAFEFVTPNLRADTDAQR
jgi:hypothetical protein